MILRLAWRNVVRHRVRSALTVVAILFSSAVVVFFFGIQRSSFANLIDATTAVFLGHLQVQPPGYNERPEISETIPASLLERVEAVPGVSVAAPRTAAFVLIASESRTYGVQLMGVDPAREVMISTVPKQVQAGAYLTGTGDLPLVVLGETLAKNLQVTVGSELTILGRAKDDSSAATVARVSGIFRTGASELDRSMAEMALRDFQPLFGVEGELNTIALKVDRIPLLAERQRALRAVVGKEAAVLRWDEIVPGLKQAMEVDMVAGWLFFGSLLVISSIGLFNTLLMSVLERMREFGVMLSLGMNRMRLFSVLVVESGILVSIGIGLGIVAGWGTLEYFKSVGFSVPGSEEVARKWNIPTVLHPRATFEVLTLGPSVFLLLAVLASLIPALRAAKTDELEALRRT